jgi:heptosyltransferase-2
LITSADPHSPNTNANPKPFWPTRPTRLTRPNVAVFLPNWIGDVVMATPLLRALRRHYGSDARLIGLGRPYVAGVLAGTPWLDEMWAYDRRSPDRRLRGWSVARRLRRERVATAVLLQNTWHSAAVAWLARIATRAGYVRYRRGPLLTLKLHPPRDGGTFRPVSAVDYYLQIAYRLGAAEEPWTLELSTTPEDERAADEAWSALGLRDADRVVVFNSSGAFGAAKLWPDEYFAQLADRVAADGYDVLMICGPAERERAARIAELAHHPRVFSLANRPLSIGLSKACVRRSRLLVTTDSGPRHFAAAFGRPVVALFGPTDIRWTDTRFAREIRLQLALECQPCQQRTCPLGHHRCMRDLTVEVVYAEVQNALNERSSPTF